MSIRTASKMWIMRYTLFLAAALVVPLTAFTGTARAYTCASGALCVYKDTHGNGATTSWGGYWHNQCWNMIPSWNNVISSVDNNMSVKVTFYDLPNCVDSFAMFDVPAGYQATAGDSYFFWFSNDTPSSVYFH